MPIVEDDSDEKKKGIRKVLKTVDSQREKKKVEKAKKANRCKSESSRRISPSAKFSNEIPAFPSMSTCYLWGKPGHF